MIYALAKINSVVLMFITIHIILISVFVSVEKKNVLHIELAHGGHLGFYEGGLLYPNPVTWLDRALVALIGSLTLNYAETALKGRNTLEIWLLPSSFSIRSILKTAWNLLYVACCLLYHKALGRTKKMSTFWQMYLSSKEWFKVTYIYF